MSFNFGSSQPQQSSGLFGSSTPSAPRPSLSTPMQQTQSLFGTSSQPQQNQQNQPAQSSLFGSTSQQQPTSTGGLFGSTAQQPASTGGLLGSTFQPQTQNNQQSGGLFGSTNTAQPTGGLFGSTNTAQPTGGLFGSTNTTQPSGGLFGSTSNNQQQTGGLFGSTNNQQQPGGLFGSTNQAQPQNQPSTGGLFGSTAQKPGGLFGTTSQTQPQQQSSSLFGSTMQPQLGSSLFGSTNQQQSNQNSLFASTSQPNQAQGSSTQPQPKPEPSIEERMTAVRNAWDTNSPDCKFKYFFYNMVDPGTSGQYGRPAGANDDAKWAKAMRDNPDPNCMVPVLATGWGDVKKRTEMQEKIASVHQEKVKELSAALAHLTRETSVTSSIRLAKLQANLNTLMHRLIHVAAQTPQYIPSMQSSSFRPEEAQMKQQLEAIKTDLDGKAKQKRIGGNMTLHESIGGGTPKRGGEGRMSGQVHELWGHIEEIRRHRRGINQGGENWLGDEKALAEVASILSAHQTALSKLTELLNNALFDTEVMRQGINSVNGQSER